VSRSLALSAWMRSEGPDVLAARLGVVPPGSPKTDDERRLRSLLDNIESATHRNRINVKWGMRIGGIVGISVGIPTGYYLLQRIFPQLDRFGATFAGILGGIVIGVIVGAVLWALLRPAALARKWLRAAYCRYPFDCKPLDHLSGAYSARVRGAVRRLTDDLALGRLDCGRQPASTCIRHLND
jgi:hypothetical protein